MEDNKYLEKVLIYNHDNLLGEYRPLTNKHNCQLTSLANNFKSINIHDIITTNNAKTSLLKVSKHRKDKPYSIKLNSEIRLFKNRRFNEYVLFLCQTPDTINNNDIYLDLCKHNINKNTRKKAKSKKRKRPKNYCNLVGVNNIFEERIRNEIEKFLPLNVTVNAIYRTEIPETPKMFLSLNIANSKDINNFIKHMKLFNANHKQIVNFSIPLKKVQAIIIINKTRRQMFVELTDKIAEKAQCCTSELIEYHKKKYINCKHLNINLCRIRWIQTKNVKIRKNKSNKSLRSNTNSVISIHEFTVKNIQNLMNEYHQNITGYTNFTSPVDNIMKDTYKMLVELQLNAIDQCNQLFLNYFMNKNIWSPSKATKFSENITTHYALLLQLKNKAIENSIFVNKRIQNVNKFLHIIRDKTVRQCFTSRDGNNHDCTNTTINNINFEDCDGDLKITLSLTNFEQTRRKEIEVQTSLAELQELLHKVMTMNKSCSAINLRELTDKKCVQTDISINKDTSIDFGGKQVQICRKNITLKTNSPENKTNIIISDSEKEILQKLTQEKKRPPTPKVINNIKTNIEPKIIKNVETNTEFSEPGSPQTEETSPENSETGVNEDDPNLEQKMAQLTAILNRIQAEETRLKSIEDGIRPKSKEVAIRPKAEVESEIQDETDQTKSKLSNILKQIRTDSRPKLRPTSRPSSAGAPTLSTIQEEIFKIPPQNHQVLYHIKNTLDLVKDRFEKNSLILRKVSDLKDNYFVSNNIKSLMDTGVLEGDFPGKPKFIKIPQPDENTLTSVKKTKQVIAMNLHTSLLLLKNLNEVTKNIKSNPINAMSKLTEIEESINIQKKLIPKVRYSKMQLTLTPIKNFIASNKMNVTDNAARLPTQKYVVLKKKSRIVRPVNSKQVLDLSRPKKLKNRRSTTSKTVIKTPKSVSTTITNVKPPKIHTSVVTPREMVPVPKIYRPVVSNTIAADTPKLSNLTLVDVAPFQTEYPRKDNLLHVDIEKTYLYKLLNNSFSDKNLEPTIQCSNANCTSCTKIQIEKKAKKFLKRRDIFKKNEPKKERGFVWEKMNWNNGITIQTDHDFDFNQYMDDPNLKRQQDVVICPVNVQYDKKNNDMGNKVKAHHDTSVKNARRSNTVNDVSSSHVILKPLSKGQTPMEQSKIQRSIQQAIIKNQEKFKFIQQSLSPKNNCPKNKANSTLVPRIISTGTIQKQKINWTKLPSGQRKNEFTRKPQDIITFEKKHKLIPSIPSLNSSNSSKHQDAILATISKTVKKSTDDMQRYIELVEQKFIKTFSMPETEKATAYTNLESEIKQMLHLLHTTKDRKTTKPEEIVQKSKITKQVAEKVVEKVKTVVKPEVKPKKKPTKKPSNTSVIVIKEPNSFICGSELAMDKKKNHDGSQPTICTDSISFSSSLAAIVSKQSFLFPTKQKSASILKNSASTGAGDNLKNCVSNKSVASNSKRVRFSIDKVSDSTVSISTDEEYSTLCEETVSSLSSEILSKPYIDISIFVCLRQTSQTVFPTCTLATYYIIHHYQLIQFNLDTDYNWPGNYEIKILCEKNSLELLQNESNFGFDDLKPGTKDSLSDFIENCEEIIQATKKLDQEKSSTHILEFLDILQSISIENLVIKVEVYVQFVCQDCYIKHFTNIYYIIDTFHSITFEKSKDLKFSELINLYKPKKHESFRVSELTENKWKVVPFTKPNSKLIPYKKMNKHFSEPEFTNDLLKFNLKMPFCSDLMTRQSETRCLEGPTYISQTNFETIYQTLVLNLQVLNCGRKPTSRHFSRRTIRKKCHSSPTKNTLQLKRFDVKFHLNKDKFLCINEPHRVFLVFLYVTIFSFAFLCMTLNYKCE